MDSRQHRLTSLSPVFLRREALAVGYDKTIRRLIRNRTWVVVRHGAYCPAELWDPLDPRGRRALVADAAYRAARTHVVLSHTSAADRFGPLVWDMPDDVHLTRTDHKAGRREAGVVQHCGQVLADDLTRIDGQWVTSGTRTALDCMTITDTEHSLVITNALLRAGETTLPHLHVRRAAMAHWRDMLNAEVVLRLADPRLESVGEDRTLFFLWTAGFPMPIPQYEITDGTGRVVARVDFAWPELGIFLEFDGKVKYEKLLEDGENASDVVFREKRREELICQLTGWRCVRITWADLLDPARLTTRLRAALAGERWAA